MLPAAVPTTKSFPPLALTSSRLEINFSANSFSKDQFRSGLEYTLITEKASFSLRAGFVYEESLFNSLETSTALSGPSGGFSFEFPFGDGGSNIGIDYGYRCMGTNYTIMG